ncbi:MAG: hypothetical protein K6B44_08225 [Lachnospiraceae bacterium]|nr:hypothetical protein [Lachnospiraceae bacterium]
MTVWKMKGKSFKINDILKNSGKAAFYTGLVCELLVSPSGFASGGFMNQALIFLGIAALFVAALTELDFKKDLLLYAAVFAFSGVFLLVSGSALVLRLGLVLLAGRRQDAGKVMKLYFYGTVLLSVYILIRALCGLGGDIYVVDNFRHVKERRFMFGFLHPNAFSFFWFRLFIMWIYLYGLRVKAGFLAIASVVFAVPFILASSKMGIAIFLYILAGVVFLRLDKNEKHVRIYHRAQQLIAAAVILFILSFLFIPYPENHTGKVENVWDALNEVTTGRFEIARDALKSNSIELLGDRSVEEATEVGYVNSLLREGILFMAVYLLLAFLRWNSSVKKKENGTALLITGFMLYSVAEAFIPYFNKNGLFITMLGVSEKDEKDKD